MATTNRVGTWLILAGGLVLVGVMAYALSLGGNGLPGPVAGDVVEVAVFFPDTNSWRNFRQGIEIGRDRGLLDVIERGTEAVTIRARESGRTIRFAWDGSLGIREIRDSLDRRLTGANPPVAVVGSTNTALTIALADELAEHAADGSASPGPVLLIPSATAVEVEPAGILDDATRPVKLLNLFPGRSFRFCLNNARFAELVVGFLAEKRRERPAEVVLVVDSFDPFSVDLAREFEQTVKDRFSGTPLTRSDPRPGTGGLAGSPSPDQIALAESIWSKAEASKGEPVWVLLTTQGSPAYRLLEVLRAYAPPPSERPRNLRVLCGDGIGRATLHSFAASLPFPVFSAASTSAGLGDDGALRDDASGQIQAEIVSALIAGLDRPGTDLAAVLASLQVPPEATAALGRSLRFADGERAGDDLGHVLEARPDEATLLAHEPAPGGRWETFRWFAGSWRPVGETQAR
jgi:hypothetical protein